MTVTPSMREFFDSAAEYLLRHPDDPSAFIERHEGWDADPERLAIYARFVQGYLRTVLGKIFRGCRARIPVGTWEELVWTHFRSGASTTWEINRAGANFPELVEARDDLPPDVAVLARFEWNKFEVFSEATEIPTKVDALTVNPTLRTLEHAWKICRFYAAFQRKQDPASVDEEDEIALVWRHPKTHASRYKSAKPRDLLALKIAVEGIELERAAEEGGVEVEDVRTAIAEAVERGLVLEPLTR